MSSRVWAELYRSIKSEARCMPRRVEEVKFSDALIVAMYFWMVLHERTQTWACQRSSYTSEFRPRRLPSVSWFSRRLRDARCQELLERVRVRWSQTPDVNLLSYIDGRPLPVGACSKDQDAKAGRVYGGFARGYKVHALVAQNGRVFQWKVTGLNEAEQTVARELLAHATPRSFVLGDGNDDATPLYEIAESRQAQLLAPPRATRGRGHRRQNPARLRANTLWREAPREWAQRRRDVERCFGNQSSFPGGLSPLPAWVRTLPRVRRWVDAKLTI